MMSQTALAGSALDLQGLDELKRQAKADPKEAMQGIARQMEGLFVQMMLKSMRDATMKDGLFNSNQTALFTSLHDQQISQEVAARGNLGFADAMLRQMAPSADSAEVSGLTFSAKPDIYRPQPAAGISVAPMRAADAAPPSLAAGEKNRGFISRLLAPAIAVSRKTGIPHQLIIAQAALESGWGNKEIMTAEGKTSHNLFGIKATGGWKGKTTEITTTEYVDGQPKKVTASFRAYDSYSAALADYATLLVSNPRYQDVSQSQSPEQAAQILQKGGYATDPAYAKKLIGIINQIQHSVEKLVNSYQNEVYELF